MDASAIVLLCSDDELKHQALLTFAIGRHALVDQQKELNRAQVCLHSERLNAADLDRVRGMYEPYANALSIHFLVALPGWLPQGNRNDNWLRTKWKKAGNLFSVSDPFQ